MGKKCIVWLCCPSSLFCEDFDLSCFASVCQIEGIIPEFKALEQLKLPCSTKSSTADKFAANQKKQCQILRSLWQNKNN